MAAGAIASGCTVRPPVDPWTVHPESRLIVASVDALAIVGPRPIGGDIRATEVSFEQWIEDLRTIQNALTDVERWRALSRRTSINFATATFRRMVTALPRNRQFGERHARALTGASHMPQPMACYQLLTVAGWRYRSHPEHGADLESVGRLARALGMDHALIDTDEDGTVEANAAVIAARLRVQHRRPIVLFSVSKGSAEVALALDLVGRDPTNHPSRVAAWINVNGLIGGTPLADRLMSAPASWLVAAVIAARGGSMQTIASMTTEERRNVRRRLRFPSDLLVVNYQAAPFTDAVGPDALMGHWLLSDWGPNDGVSLLADALVADAITLLEPASDHFLRLADRDHRIEALLRATIEEARSAAGTPPGHCPI